VREGLHKIVSDDETIVAVATPLGHSGIGLVRMSGPQCRDVARRFFKSYSSYADLQHRVVQIGTWNGPPDEQIDEVVITFFQAPHSYTGEDVLEISAHGNPFVLRRIVETARAMGVRLAAPGEFTLRAVAHGKMDLLQAEAVRDFIQAQTEQQAKTALRQMDGSVAKHIRPIKDKLADVIAHLEAGIDFAEDDVDVPKNDGLISRIQPLRHCLLGLKETFGYGKILTNGLRLAILGKPNAGKSSLFNRLVSADRAIVTDTPGTTRDVLTETINMDGVPLCFADTAGIRDTTDPVESIGVTRTFEMVAEADLALIVLDHSRAFDEDDRRVLQTGTKIPYLVIVNKADLPRAMDLSLLNGTKRVTVSAKTGTGFEELNSAVREFIGSRKSSLTDDVVLTSSRQYGAVIEASEALNAAEAALTVGVPHEMVLLDLYRALQTLDELTGEMVTDDILARIFSTFCVGK
jgi:tRNA modification GTPase